MLIAKRLALGSGGLLAARTTRYSVRRWWRRRWSWSRGAAEEEPSSPV